MAGNIKIIEPTENYQKVSKGIIFNREIDVLTLGIYVKVLCLGKEWELNIQGLAQTLNLSDSKIRTAFSLLERAGYVKRVQIKDNKTGHFLGYDYHIGFEPFPEDERTDLVAIHKKESRPIKTQTLENPDSGKTGFRETQTLENRGDIYRDNNIDRDKKENKNNISISTPPKIFYFRKALLDAGVEPEVADAWMQVRKAKKAVNTKIAWDAIDKELRQAWENGHGANECINLAVVRSWAGFKWAWMENEIKSTTRAPRPAPPRKNDPLDYDFTQDY